MTQRPQAADAAPRRRRGLELPPRTRPRDDAKASSCLLIPGPLLHAADIAASAAPAAAAAAIRCSDGPCAKHNTFARPSRVFRECYPPRPRRARLARPRPSRRRLPPKPSWPGPPARVAATPSRLRLRLCCSLGTLLALSGALGPLALLGGAPSRPPLLVPIAQQQQAVGVFALRFGLGGPPRGVQEVDRLLREEPNRR